MIPADSKTHRNVMVRPDLLRDLAAMKLAYPPAKPELEGVQVE